MDGTGLANLDWLRERLSRWDAADGRPFVALMLANNETGVISPISQAAELVREAGGLAACGRRRRGREDGEIDLEKLGADSLAVSAHKIGGPQGIGCLAWSERVTPVRQMHGGGHERGFRSGTENMPGIAGFAAAMQASAAELPHAHRQAEWRDAAAARLKSASVPHWRGGRAPHLFHAEPRRAGLPVRHPGDGAGSRRRHGFRRLGPARPAR